MTSLLLTHILCPQFVNLCPSSFFCTKAESRRLAPLRSMFASGLLINIQGVFTASLDNIHSSFSFMAFNFSSLLEVEQISCSPSLQGHGTIDRHSLPLLCWKNMYLAFFRFPFSRLNKSSHSNFSSHVIFVFSSHFHHYSAGFFQCVGPLSISTVPFLR